jgi:tetratricopeptide (TPR) repeat protein
VIARTTPRTRSLGLALVVAAGLGLPPGPAGWPGTPPLALATLNQSVPLQLEQPAAAPADAGAGVAEVEGLLERWRPEEASRTLEPLLASRPRHPALRALGARIALYRGDYVAAARLAEGTAPQPVRDWLATTRDLVGPMAPAESRHFVLRHAPADAILAKPVLEALEKAHAVLAAEWGFEQPEGMKVRVELFPDARSFYPATGLSRRDIETSGAVGLCIFNKVMLLSPRALLQGYRWLDAVVHEYVHYAIVHLTANTAPIWLHEGIAKHYETRWRAAESRYLQPVQRTLLAEAVASGRFVPFGDMEPSLVKLPGPREVQLSYAEGASAVEFLEQAAGPGALRRLFAVMASGAKDGAARQGIEALLGVPFAEFERRWQAFVAAKRLAPVEGIELPAYHVKEGPESDGVPGRVDEALEVRLLRSAAARMHVRLGDRLRERGRLTPAILEYQKAIEKAPPSATLLTRLGRALAAAGRRAEARDRLTRALSLYPDYPAAYVALGRLELAEGRHEAAAAAMREALEINPFDPTPHAGLSVALRALGKPAEAAAAEQTARALGFTGE